MVLGIREDFTSTVAFDAQLTALPESGLYLNEGVHPSITVGNLLSFLPFPDVTFTAWDDETTYGKYESTKVKTDIVSYSGKIYQSLQGANLNKQPDTQTAYWLETNLESLKIKAFIDKVQAKVYSELNLTKRLINNQFIYSGWDSNYLIENLLPNDYAAWVFEPKGSDYVTIKLNQVSFSKSGTTPVNLYVINQGVLVTTLQLTPSNGIVDFKDLNYSFSGKGQWMFAIDSTEVIGRPSYIDPSKYDGFVCYTATGIGADLDNVTWSYGNNGNGLGFNVSVFLDAQVYIDNNIDYLANFVRATFELMALEMFMSNANNRSNREQLIQMDMDRLLYETRDLTGFTVAKRYNDEKKRALRVIGNSFDTQLSADDEFNVTIGSV